MYNIKMFSIPIQRYYITITLNLSLNTSPLSLGILKRIWNSWSQTHYSLNYYGQTYVGLLATMRGTIEVLLDSSDAICT